MKLALPRFEQAVFLGQIDRLLSRCWDDSAMNFLAEIYSMNDHQRQQVRADPLSMGRGRCFDRFTQQLLESRSSAVKYLGVSRAPTGINGVNRRVGQFMVHVPQVPNPVCSGSSND